MKRHINFCFPIVILFVFLSHPLMLRAQCSAFVADAQPLNEGNNRQFVVFRTGTGDCSVVASTANETAVGGTVCNGNTDYISLTNFAFVIPSGQNTKTIVIPTCNDVIDEPEETFVLNLQAGPGTTITSTSLGDQQGRARILDDDPPPNLSINDIRVNEGNPNHSADFELTLSNESALIVSVDYNSASVDATEGSSCGSGADFINLGGRFSFLPGEKKKNLSIPICDDTVIESDAHIVVTLLPSTSVSTNANIVDNRGQATIVDDDLPIFSVQSTQHAEGNSGLVDVLVTINLSARNPSGASVSCVPQELPVNGLIKPAQGGSACGPGIDFIFAANTAVFGPNDTSKTCKVTVCGDTTKESDEGFLVTLQRPQGGRVISDSRFTNADRGVLIKNDD